MRVGIFDSGIGGLSVLHQAMKIMPDVDFVYYADESHVPYGEKTTEEICFFLKDIFSFMLEKKVEAIVIACNTATSAMPKKERAKYKIPIMGMEPAIKIAFEKYGNTNKKILVAATPVTIRGEKLKRLIDNIGCEDCVDTIALPMLVKFAEKGYFEGEEVKKYLEMELRDFYLEEYVAVVLGCTHFNYFKGVFREILGESIHFVDGNEGVIRQLGRMLKKEKIESGKKGSVEFYFSGKICNKVELERIGHNLAILDKNYNL